MKSGDIRSWSISEMNKSCFLVVDVTQAGIATILEDGVIYEFRVCDVEMHSRDLNDVEDVRDRP